MGVAVDKPRHDERSPGIDDASPLEFQRDAFGVSHGRDIRAVNGHSATGQDRILFIHRHNDAAGNNEIHIFHPFLRSPV